MRHRSLFALSAFLFVLLTPGLASAAAAGYTTGNVNMRAGPGTANPVITTIPAGAPVQIIGAWNPRTHIFRWAWDHPMVVQRLRNDAERLRWFGDKHGIDELTQRSLKMDEQEAWQMTALAMKVNGSHGVYRAPTEGPVIFMTLGEPKVRK